MSDWKDTTLGDVLQFQRGFDITKKEQECGNIPVVSSSGIASYHNKAKAKAPGVVIGRKGTLGTVHYINSKYWAHDTTLWVKDFKSNLPKFIYYFLKVMHLENYDTGASNPTLNRNHIHKIKLKFPPLPIQQKIEAVLSAYDDLIENNNRRIALLEKMAEEIYREWFVRLRFPGYEQVTFHKGIPEGWVQGVVSDVTAVMSGGTPKTHIPSYWGGDIPFLTPTDIHSSFYALTTEKTLTEDGLKKCSSKLYPCHTVFITARGTVGKLVMNQRPMAVNQTCYALKGKSYISQFFLFIAMRFIVEHFRKAATGGVFDTIVTRTFESIPFLVPPSDTVRAFEDSVSPIFSLIEELLLTNQSLQRTHDRLLTRLISGKLSVEDLDIQFPPSMTEELEANHDR
jgi:type I restriction enzyme, S subunit